MVTAGHGKGQMDTEMDTVEPMAVWARKVEDGPAGMVKMIYDTQAKLIAETRNAALEEAAKVCEGDSVQGDAARVRRLASVIRALKR